MYALREQAIAPEIIMIEINVLRSLSERSVVKVKEVGFY